MNNRRLFVAGIVAGVTLPAIFCLPLPVNAQDHAKDKAAIQSAIQKTDEATNKRDANGYVAFTHPEFVNINKNGRETTHGKEERQKKIGLLFASTIKASSRTTISKIIFTKDGAIVDSSNSYSLTLSKNGQTVEQIGEGTSRDLWVKTAGGWLQKRSRTLTSNITTQNGRPVP